MKYFTSCIILLVWPGSDWILGGDRVLGGRVHSRLVPPKLKGHVSDWGMNREAWEVQG